jgi:hypothetical protein
LRFDPLTKITAERVPAEDLPQAPFFGKDVYRPVEEQVFPMAAFERMTAWGGDVTRPFVEGILAGTPPMTPGREALEVTRVIAAAYRSVQEQRPIALALESA